MTPTTCGKPSPPRARLPSFPTIPRVHSNTNSTSISTPSAISSNVASASSNSSDASQPATKKPRETTPQSSLSRLSSYGSDKCPQNLAQAKNLRILVIDSCRDNPLADQL